VGSVSKIVNADQNQRALPSGKREGIVIPFPHPDDLA